MITRFPVFWAFRMGAGIFLSLVGFVRADESEQSLTNSSPLLAISQEKTDVHPQEVYTNVAVIRALSPEEVAQNRPVRLRGTVVFKETYDKLLLSDGSISIYGVVDSALTIKDCQRGDMIEVEGVINQGLFAPNILIRKVTKLGEGCIPDARPVVFDDMLSGDLHAQWVQISGVVRQMGPWVEGWKSRRLQLFTGGGRLTVRLPKEVADGLSMGSEVRVSGVCGYNFNKAHQLLDPRLLVPEGEPVITVRPGPEDPFSLRVSSIGRLQKFNPEYVNGRGVLVEGVVTHFEAGEGFWIRDKNRGLRVLSPRCDGLDVGDQVKVFGFPLRGGYSPMLEDAIFKKVGVSGIPKPICLANVAQAFDHDANLVEMEASISERHRIQGGLQVTLAKGGESFAALLPQASSNTIPREWSPGSVVRVSGICQVELPKERKIAGPLEATSFRLLLRSPTDLLILQSPPWWTPQRIAILLWIVIGSLLLLVASVIVMARLHLRRQAEERAQAEAEFKAVLSERNRIAREIHDTLAQGLTAIWVHLDLVRRKVPKDSLAVEPLETARALVRSSLDNVRSTIMNMRSQVLETGDLVTALSSILKTLPGKEDIQSEIRVLGQSRRLAPVTENNVLRIGQEAILNAARHGRARTIEVTLAFEERCFRLEVKDDGAGFDPAQPPKSESGFGLLGMRERSQEIGGTLKVISEPGKGTVVSLEVPLPAT